MRSLSSASATTATAFQRPIPALSWTALASITAIALVLLVAAWERHCRAIGYAPGLDDTSDLWVEQRRSVRPDETVIIGASRGLYGLDLDELESALGRRPVQLCLVGSCVYPILQDFADDASFHGTVICDLVPGLLLVPPMAPPYHNAEKALERKRTQSLTQRASHLLSLPLERTFACLQMDDLTLADLLRDLRIPNRAHAQLGAALPPYFGRIDRDRRTWMIDRVQTDAALRDRIQRGWIPLFSPPPKPHWIPDQAFGAYMHAMVDGRFAAMAKAVDTIRQRGGKVVFLRMPSTGDLRVVEDRLSPRTEVWDRLLREANAPGVYAEDHPELCGFDIPESSHLSATASVEFTRQLAPYIRTALAAH